MADVLTNNAELSAKQNKLLELLKRQQQQGPAAAPPVTAIPRRGPSEPPVLSFGQKRLWFIEQLQPGNAAYNVPGAVRIRGPLQADVLQRCLDEIGRRHEILRTSFRVVDGEPVPVIASRPSLRLVVTDLRNVPAGDREYGGLVSGISELLEQARRTTGRAVNSILTATYWEVGRRIGEVEQGGKAGAE